MARRNDDSGTFKFLVEEIRAKAGGKDFQNDYLEQRRTLLESVEAGRKLEEEVERIELRLDKMARQQTVEQLFDRIKALEDERKRRRSVMQFLKGLVLAAAGAVAASLMERHKG
jgi:hypothetical protein